jgi:hypothetical protein
LEANAINLVLSVTFSVHAGVLLLAGLCSFRAAFTHRVKRMTAARPEKPDVIHPPCGKWSPDSPQFVVPPAPIRGLGRPGGTFVPNLIGKPDFFTKDRSTSGARIQKVNEKSRSEMGCSLDMQ